MRQKMLNHGLSGYLYQRRWYKIPFQETWRKWKGRKFPSGDTGHLEAVDKGFSSKRAPGSQQAGGGGSAGRTGTPGDPGPRTRTRSARELRAGRGGGAGCKERAGRCGGARVQSLSLTGQHPRLPPLRLLPRSSPVLVEIATSYSLAFGHAASPAPTEKQRLLGRLKDGDG